MADKFRNKYRIASARNPNWDYRWNAAYFITICTKNRAPFFGEIHEGKMIFSNVGVIADLLWFEIKNRSEYIELGEFVVMPNHMHGILILNNAEIHRVDDGNDANYSDDNGAGNDGGGDNDGDESDDGDNSDVVQTRHALSLAQSGSQSQSQSKKSIGQKRLRNPGKNSISSIVGGYKSAVTKHANRLGYKFAWQTRFHDHIIRDDAAFQRISNYIIRNPSQWGKDKFHQ